MFPGTMEQHPAGGPVAGGDLRAAAHAGSQRTVRIVDREFADEHGLALVSIEDLKVYRRLHESQVVRLAETRLPTEFGTFTALGYRDIPTSKLVQMRIHDVTPEFIRNLRSQGIASPSADQLVRLKISGFEPGAR